VGYKGMRNRDQTKKILEPHEKRILEIFEEIDKKYPEVLIIVEGIRDENLLRDFGLKARILRTQMGLSRPELVHKIESNLGPSREVLILTDFDAEGIEIAAFLKTELELMRTKILERYRREIALNMGNLRCIEELVVLFKRRYSPEPA
jgi:5S rRNA maturation endonuclease (ribonuclease M5)